MRSTRSTYVTGRSDDFLISRLGFLGLPVRCQLVDLDADSGIAINASRILAAGSPSTALCLIVEYCVAIVKPGTPGQPQDLVQMA